MHQTNKRIYKCHGHHAVFVFRTSLLPNEACSGPGNQVCLGGDAVTKRLKIGDNNGPWGNL